MLPGFSKNAGKTMMIYPKPIFNYLKLFFYEKYHPAYIELDPSGVVIDFGGELDRFGLKDLQKGRKLDEQKDLFFGLLPHEGEPFILPFMETGTGTPADIHIFKSESSTWVLYLDTTVEKDQMALLQQKGNELAMLRDRQAKILDQYLGKEITKDIVAGALDIKEEGDRKELTVLFADIRGFTPLSETLDPAIVFNVLNIYLRAMIQSILQEGGFIDKIIGDAVMGLFGIMVSADSPPNQALKTAFKMLNRIREINKVRQKDQRVCLNIGIGIATGEAVIGILGAHERKAFSAIGHHVNLAARLESEARPGEILIDETTYKKATVFTQKFEPVALSLKGITGQVSAYSFQQSL